MVKSMFKKFVSMLMAGTLALTPVAASFIFDSSKVFADTDTATEGDVSEGDTRESNSGDCDTNSGTITENTDSGNVDVNAGTVTTNNGDIGNNTGLVSTNNGDIDSNNGSVLENTATGVITNNDALASEANPNLGVITNDGWIETNSGNVNINNGVYKDEVIADPNANPPVAGSPEVALGIGTNTETGNVNVNNGTVKENHGSVGENNGKVVNNSGEHAKVVTNAEGGSVLNNTAKVEDNFGQVCNDAGGTVERNKSGGTIPTNNGNVEENEQGGVIAVNNSEVNKNEGTITTQRGEVRENKGTIDRNEFTNSQHEGVRDNQGQINTNLGIVDINNAADASAGITLGTISLNQGKVVVNKGTITENSATGSSNGPVTLTEKGTVETNKGTIGTNNGVVENNFGTVSGGSGTIENNYGNASTGGNTVVKQWWEIWTNSENNSLGERVSNFFGAVVSGVTDLFKSKDESADDDITVDYVQKDSQITVSPKSGEALLGLTAVDDSGNTINLAKTLNADHSWTITGIDRNMDIKYASAPITEAAVTCGINESTHKFESNGTALRPGDFVDCGSIMSNTTAAIQIEDPLNPGTYLSSFDQFTTYAVWDEDAQDYKGESRLTFPTADGKKYRYDGVQGSFLRFTLVASSEEYEPIQENPDKKPSKPSSSDKDNENNEESNNNNNNNTPQVPVIIPTTPTIPASVGALSTDVPMIVPETPSQQVEKLAPVITSPNTPYAAVDLSGQPVAVNIVPTVDAATIKSHEDFLISAINNVSKANITNAVSKYSGFYASTTVNTVMTLRVGVATKANVFVVFVDPVSGKKTYVKPKINKDGTISFEVPFSNCQISVIEVSSAPKVVSKDTTENYADNKTDDKKNTEDKLKTDVKNESKVDNSKKEDKTNDKQNEKKDTKSDTAKKSNSSAAEDLQKKVEQAENQKNK